MYVNFDFAKKRNCWNLDSVYTCLGCGCCTKNKRDRYLARIRYCEGKIEELKNFSSWSTDGYLRSLQEVNIAKDFLYFRRRERYYKSKLKDLEVKDDAENL